MGLELCERHLDRVEVGRVRRQIAQLRASGLDDLSNIVVLVGGQIVHHHDVAWLQGRDQASLQVDAKDLAIHRLVDDKGSGDSVVAQCRDEGGDLPVTVWNLADQALATAAAATQSRHVGRGAGLIDEDEAGWIKQPLLRFPDLAGHRHVGPILLGRVNAFF